MGFFEAFVYQDIRVDVIMNEKIYALRQSGNIIAATSTTLLNLTLSTKIQNSD